MNTMKKNMVSRRGIGHYSVAMWFVVLLALSACGGGGTTGGDSTETETEAVGESTEQETAEPAAEPESLKILYTPAFTGHLPPLIAEDAGILDAHGLDVEFVSSNEPLAPLLSGDVDVALPAPAVAVVGVAQGQDLKILMSIQGRITQKLLVTPEVAEGLSAQPGDYPAVVNELEGRRIAVTVRGGSVDLNLRYMLQVAGLTPEEDVTVVPAGGGGPMLAALREGQVDGILGFPPLADILISSDEAVSLIDLAKGEGPVVLDQPFVVAAVTGDFLSERPEVAESFVDAMVEAIDWIRDSANADELKEIVTARLEGVDPELMDGVIEELVSTMDPSFTTDHLDRVNELQRVVGALEREVTADEVIATQLVPAS